MDEQQPIRLDAQTAWTVSQLTAHVKQTLETAFRNVCVVGEISRCTRAVSGHVYLTLKDEGAVLSAAIWRPVASRIKFKLEEGLEVVARGSIDVYPPRGSYQLIVSDLQPRGLGALQLAYRQLLEKLEKEGLFAPERKKPLPPFPRRIGIVTSPTGAAIRDMANVVFRRWPLAELYLLPRRVQGEGAAEEIAAAIGLLNAKRKDLDLIIVGRGGGSLEDLWAFNEEVVARAIYASELPVVSAVGHEIDFSISDFVADLRAATPTEAGEKAVPDQVEVMRNLGHLRKRMAASLEGVVQDARGRLRAIAQRHILRHPEAVLQMREQKADELLERLRTCARHALELLSEKMRAAGAALGALNPLSVLDRGYSITFAPDGSVLRSVEMLASGDLIRTRLLDGEIKSGVNETKTMDAPTVETPSLERGKKSDA